MEFVVILAFKSGFLSVVVCLVDSDPRIVVASSNY